MSRSRQKPWLERQRSPDPQVRGAAEQYNAARRLLAASPLGSSVLLPLMNAAIVALELYLKALSSERVHQFWSLVPAFWTVHAKPKVRNYPLVSVFDAIPDEIRSMLDEQFTQQGLGADGSVREALEKYEGLFAMSRYPFELGSNISKYPPERLLRLVDFMSAFVADLATTEEPQ